MVSDCTTIVGTRPVECQGGQFGRVSKRRPFCLCGLRGGQEAMDKCKLPPAILSFEWSTSSCRATARSRATYTFTSEIQQFSSKQNAAM